MTSIQDKIKELNEQIKNTPIVELMFSALDKNGDGNLHIDEFKTQSKMQNPNSITNKLYVNGDINLGHFKEYIMITPDFAVSDIMSPINQTFSMVDKDNSDSISREELGSVGFKDLGLELFFSLFDSDKNGSVSVSEIMSVLADNSPNTSPVAPSAQQNIDLEANNNQANRKSSLCKGIDNLGKKEIPLYKLAFMAIDKDNDSTINGGEYKNARKIVDGMPKYTYPGIEGYFSPASINDDTKISFDNWEQALSGSVQTFTLNNLESEIGSGHYDSLEDKLLGVVNNHESDDQKFKLVLEILSYGFSQEINEKTINTIMREANCAPNTEGGGRKVRSNKGKKRGAYKSRKANNVTRHPSGRKVRSNKGKKRGPYGPRTGRTRSGKKFR